MLSRGIADKAVPALFGAHKVLKNEDYIDAR
jgi:hypothetical protein